MKKYKNVTTLIIMIIITSLTQILTLMKSSIVAGIFGTSLEMDAYNFSNSIVSFLFGFVASGISTVIIPAYVEKKERKSIDSFITILYLIMAAIVLIMIIFRFHIVGLFSNKGELYLNITCNILIVLLLSNYLLSFSNITEAYFQCREKYILPKAISLLSQIIIIIILIFNNTISIIEYTYIIAFGLVFNFFFETIFAIKYDWRFKPRLLFKEKSLKSMFYAFVPIVFSTGVYKLSLIVDSIIANTLDTGKITILSYSSQIVNIVNTVLVSTLLTYSYPKIIKKIKENANQVFFWKQTILYHFIVCLIIALFYCVGKDCIELLFLHGKFTSQDANMLYIASLIYIIGQQSNIVRDMIYRYFYAKGNTTIAAKNSTIVSIMNIIISLILVKIVGFYGIILGTIISSFFSLIMILFIFYKKYGFDISIIKLVYYFIKNIIIVSLSVLIVIFTKNLLNIDLLIYRIMLYSLEFLIICIIITYFINKKIYKYLKEI